MLQYPRKGYDLFDYSEMVVKEVVALAVTCLSSGLGLAYLLLYILPLRHNKSKCVAVLVLGDIGRSPRMQNHAVALANAGWKVELIGFKGDILQNLC